MPTDTIRYRRDDRPGLPALLVEDARGTGYRFSSGALQARCAGLGGLGDGSGQA